MNKRLAIIFCIFLSFIMPLTAEDDLDSLFDQGDMIEQDEEIEQDVSPETEVLVNKGADIGGKFYSTFTSKWSWYEDSDESDLNIDIGASIFLDARPDDDFRFFLKVKAFYPFNIDSSNFLSENSSGGVEIVEMFSDFNINKTLFFRTGKQIIKWGVGYFFSPADVLNLSRIDPENPEDELEGPVAIKAHLPIGINNLYFYAIADEIDKPDEISFASKFEFVLGRTEIGVGGFYKNNYAPKGMLTLSTSISDVQIFGEAVLSYGSNKTFIETTSDFINYPLGVKTFTNEDEFFFSGTAGFNYTISEINLSFIGQYYYNGEGYDRNDSDELWHDSFPGILALKETDEISTADLINRGKHYGAGTIYYKDMFDSDFSIALFWIGNFSDFSGQIKPSVIWTPSEYAKISISVPVFYGEQYDEYSLLGSSTQLELSVSVGGGKF